MYVIITFKNLRGVTMALVKCKECGKEINQKAEICPHCGCRVKSNIIKFVVICLIVIAILVGGFFTIKGIKQKIDKDNKQREQEVLNKQKDEIDKNESKLFESYLGTYKLSYNDIAKNELSNFTFVSDINIKDKCYFDTNHDVAEEGDIVENCINAIDFETIKSVIGMSSTMYYVYKIDDKNTILSFQFQNIAKTTDSSELNNTRICFKQEDENNLIQTECPKRKNGKASYDDMASIDVKYEFKLIKLSKEE